MSSTLKDIYLRSLKQTEVLIVIQQPNREINNKFMRFLDHCQLTGCDSSLVSIVVTCIHIISIDD